MVCVSRTYALGAKTMEFCIKYHNLCKHKFEIGNAVLLIHNMI